MLDICLMGTGGSMPKPDRWLSSILLRSTGTSVVIDCGEGTQLAMKKAGFTFKQVGLILITHFHADHVSGLPGMLLSMGNEGRRCPVVIAGPRGTKHIVASLCVIAPGLPFEVIIYEFPHGGGKLPKDIFLGGDMHISSFNVRHSIECLGYRIDIPRPGKFNKSAAFENNVPIKLWNTLQKGESVIQNGITYSPDMVLGPERKGISVSCVTDTRPTEEIIKSVQSSDLLICEGMFGEEKMERAKKSMHMTIPEAANIAKNADVKRLWLTHYSPSLNNPEDYLDIACAVFPNTQMGYDGMKDLLCFDNSLI